MMHLKSYTTKFAARGAVVFLGLILFIFYVYPPLLLFLQGGGAIAGGLFTTPDFVRALGNSLKISTGVFLLTTILGGFLAWLVVKTDFPFTNIIDTLSIVSFALPPYIIALSWLQVFGRNGYAQRIVCSLFGGVNWQPQPYSLVAVIVVLSLHLFPLMYMSIRNALEKLNPAYEKAALLSGATKFQVFWTVTLPMISSSLFSTGLLIFSRTMANFAVPALLCLPIGIEVVPTGIYSALSNLSIDVAAGFSIVLVLISSSLHIFHWLLLRKNRVRNSHFGGKQHFFKLGKKIIPATIFVAIIVFICIIPFISMLVSSFLLRWGLPLSPQYFTLKNYAQICNPQGPFFRAFRNSFFYGGTAAFLASVVGTGAILASRYLKNKTRLVFETAASWPMAIPNTVLAVAAIFAWNKAPLRLYGTQWAIIVTYMVLFTPIIMKQVTGLLSVHDEALSKAARTMGASAQKSFFSITLPLIAPGYKSGILLCLMIALREIPISLLLYSAGQETVGVLLFGMQSQSYGLEMTSALAVIVIIITLIVDRLLNIRKKPHEQT